MAYSALTKKTSPRADYGTLLADLIQRRERTATSPLTARGSDSGLFNIPGDEMTAFHISGTIY